MLQYCSKCSLMMALIGDVSRCLKCDDISLLDALKEVESDV
mgnify:CR=1 FL=1